MPLPFLTNSSIKPPLANHQPPALPQNQPHQVGNGFQHQQIANIFQAVQGPPMPNNHVQHILLQLAPPIRAAGAQEN